MLAATFGWLCVETYRKDKFGNIVEQPPSGGCVLKPCQNISFVIGRNMQPPSGGCVLKHQTPRGIGCGKMAATFGWLCVETLYSKEICS